jgi:molecular chaperone GrpE
VPDDAKRDTGPEAPDRPGTEERASDGAAEQPDGDALAGKGTEDPAERFEKLPTIEVEGELLDEAAAPSGRDVEGELAAAQAEAERHLDDLRRLKADFENYRKRVLREQTARAQSASQALVTKLLPVLDHFELAMTALAADDGKGSGDLDKMRKGVEMVLGELRDVLRGEGLEPIEAEGKPFDPQRHEAVASVEAGDEEPGTVVGVVRAGYELHGRVIRPAMVRVAQ